MAITGRIILPGEYFIIESIFPITLTEFAQLVSNHCNNAVNLVNH